MEMKVIIWLFPILFMFHDFEEIIFVQVWLNRNRQYLSEQFPVLSKRLLHHFDNVPTAAFALGVAEEFVIISIITVSAYLTNWYNLWLGLFVAFTLHLIIHCVQALIVKRYIPVIATSIICLPICIYIIKNIIKLFSLDTVMLYSVLGFIIMVANMAILYKGMNMFGKWVVKYERLSR